MTDALTPPSPPRRRWLGAAVAAGAAAAGAGVAWWRLRPDPSANDVQALWALQLSRPEGGELVLANLKGKPLVVNFWATWCAPCVRELPALNQFHREFGPQGWQVVALAIDGPTPVREFLKKTPLDFPVGLAGLDGTEVMRALGNSNGGLPFSVVIDASGRIVQRKLGETSLEELSRWARGA